ncbi:MAG: HypC/HybG/HupF family hydrogenase formation chaperone [Paracoccaceae bacterium]|nr:HypC/HybG/HupF family hydrogenase formation chaperone [Paracoccaceae bacterium]
MCVGVPMEILSADGLVATASDGVRTETIDLSLVGPQPRGSWVLTLLGAAREVLDADEAAKITAALDGLRALMTGGSLGDAFADLEAAGPRLPPHLEAAHARGDTEA